MGPQDQIFFQDESTFYQSGTSHRKWARKGSHPSLKIYGTRSKKNVFGFINPLTGASHFLYIKRLNSECFIDALKLLLREYEDSRRLYVVIDNAPAHKSKKVRKFEELHSDRLKLIRLPPYSPDLNPIELVWREVKKDVVYNTFYRYYQDFEEALTNKFRTFSPERIKSLCNVQKYGIEVN